MRQAPELDDEFLSWFRCRRLRSARPELKTLAPDFHCASKEDFLLVAAAERFNCAVVPRLQRTDIKLLDLPSN